MDDIDDLLSQIKEWNRLIGLATVTEVRVNCEKRLLEALRSLEGQRMAWHEHNLGLNLKLP